MSSSTFPIDEITARMEALRLRRTEEDKSMREHLLAANPARSGKLGRAMTSEEIGARCQQLLQERDHLEGLMSADDGKIDTRCDSCKGAPSWQYCNASGR